MINIDYDPTRQFCIISSNNVNSTWKQICFQYSPLILNGQIYEDKIELPWHVFASHLNILNSIHEYFEIDIVFTKLATKLINESFLNNVNFKNIGQYPTSSSVAIRKKLKRLGFQRELTREQLRNITKLYRFKFGATFSVPGAGKTSEAIAFFQLHKEFDQGLIVICPKNAFPAWEEQFSICLGSKSPTIIRLKQGSKNIENSLRDNTKGVFLISYQQFIRVQNTIADFLSQHKMFVFLDESHRIKSGYKGETGRQVQNIAHLPIGKLIMTGTPMPNSISDLRPQFSFLFPTEDVVEDTELIKKIRSIYVRTTKKELGLKKPLIIKTEIPLSEPQRKLYELTRSEEARKLAGIKDNDLLLMRKLGKSYIRLLQIVSNPSLLLKNFILFPDTLREAIDAGISNKIRYAIVKARQLSKLKKKVIIWSGFVENVESVSYLLSDLGAQFIHGGVEAGNEDEANTRERIVKDFHNDPNMYALVANPAACSEGISLHTVCHHAIYIDRNYNAAQFLQSMDRIHRLGLPKNTNTTIEILNSPNSIDELVDSRLINKISRMSEVLDDKSLRVEPVTVELDEDGFDELDARELIKHLKGDL